MAGETIEFGVVVDAKQAQAEAAKFAGKLSEIEKSAAVSSGRLDMLQKSAKGLQEKMGPAAAAISSVSAALGASGGEAGKVVAVVGQLAAAFGAGGPFGVAVVAATTAVDYLTKSWEAEIKAQDEALKKTYASVEKQFELLRKAREETDKARREAMPQEWRTSADRKKAREDIAKEIESFTIQREKKQRRVSELPEEKARLDAEARALEARRVEMEKQFEIMDRAERYRKAEADQAEFDRKRQEEEDKKKANRAKRQEERIQQIKDTEDAVRGLIAEEEKWREIEGKIADADALRRGKELQDAFAMYDAEFKAAEQMEKARTALAEEEASKRAAIAEAERKAQIDSLTATASAAAAAVGAFAAQSAMGQEAALSTLLSAAAQAAGGQIMLKGGEVIAGGIAGMLAAPNPASAAQIAGGLGLVAAGSAVQTGGPAAVSALLGMAGAGKSGSGTERSMGAADRGAAPRSSSGGGSGGPLVVNISYGVGGPLPEDTAREVARVMKTNDRRRGAA